MEAFEALRRLREYLNGARAEQVSLLIRGVAHDEYMRRCGQVQQVDATLLKLTEILKAGEAD